MTAKLNKKTLFLLGIIMVVLGVCTYQWKLRSEGINNLLNSVWLEQPREVKEFALEGGDHKPFNNASIQGKWTLVFFGFTSCSSLCPTTMSTLGKMYKLLENSNVSSLPQVVMVTLDPARDHIENLQAYVRGFNPNFIGARSKDEMTVSVMARELGIVSMKVEDEKNSENYYFDHSGTILLFNPKGQLAAYFTTPLNAASMAHDYKVMIKRG